MTSDAFKEAVLASETSEVVIALLTISHPELAEPIRVARNQDDVFLLNSFSRASKATYKDGNKVLRYAAVDEVRRNFHADGSALNYLIEAAATNLIKYPKEPTNAVWEANNTTLTLNALLGPDELTGGAKLQANSAALATFGQSFTITDDGTTFYAFSVFVKKGNQRYMSFEIEFTGGSDPRTAYLTIDFNDGSVIPGVNQAPDVYGSEQYADGWWRVWLVQQCFGSGETTVNAYVLPAADTDKNYTAGYSYVWGVQVEVGAQPTSYIFPSTNYLLWSEQFDNPSWFQSSAGITVTPNVTTDPLGGNTADKIETTTSDFQRVSQFFGIANDNTSYTASIYVKQGNKDTVDISVELLSADPNPPAQKQSHLVYTFSTGTLTTLAGAQLDSYHVVDAGNGWFRIDMTTTNNSQDNTNFFLSIVPGADASFNFSPGYVYVWGAQVEEGTKALDYVRTTSTQITQPMRAADVADIVQFVGLAFELVLPQEGDDLPYQASVQMDNVSQEIVRAIRSITSPAIVDVSVVLASSPDVVEAELTGFELRNVTYDAGMVQGDLVLENFLNEPYPSANFDPARFPGGF